MDEDVKKRIEKFLASNGQSLDTISKARVEQFEKTDAAIQGRLSAISEAHETLKTSGISVFTISADTGISRKTFYNNDLLRLYVEKYSTTEEKTAPAEEFDRIKSRSDELERQFQKMVLRDVDYENLLAENDKLKKEIETLVKRNSILEEQNAELQKEIFEASSGNGHFKGAEAHSFNEELQRQMSVHLNKQAPNMSLTQPLNANDCLLGVSAGNVSDFVSALKVADGVGTKTLMLYCDAPAFSVPDKETLKAYNITIHGPLRVNLGSEDQGMRNWSVQRVASIIRKCNTFASNITALVLHPGNADTQRYFVESMKELLPIAKFPIAVETMAGQGNQLLSSMADMKELELHLGSYRNFSFCIDTCHMHDAGIRLDDPERFLTELAGYIDLSRISVIHLNDSMSERGSHKDRHANIGTGYINLEFLRFIVKAKLFEKIPKILETPQQKENNVYGMEIEELLSYSYFS